MPEHFIKYSDFSVGWAADVLWFVSQHGNSLQNVQTGAGAHLAPYTMGTWGSFPGSKVARSEVDHSPPFSAEVKNEWNYTYITHIPS